MTHSFANQQPENHFHPQPGETSGWPRPTGVTRRADVAPPQKRDDVLLLSSLCAVGRSPSQHETQNSG